MNKRLSLATVLYFVLWTAYFTYFWAHALRYDDAGNVAAGHGNLWADWALHYTLGYAMVERELLLTANPLLIDHPFSYPFVADLVSALLMKGGVDPVAAFVAPSFVFSMLLVGALYYFLHTLFRSQAVAVLGGTLFLLSGGLGFVTFFQDVLNSPAPLHTLLNPPHEYTKLDHLGIRVISIIDSMLIPQRSFTMGFPIALIALGLIHATLSAKPPDALGRADWLRLSGAALLLGTLPIVHAHSLLASFVILACWSWGYVLFVQRATSWQLIRPWLLVGLVTTALALPLIRLFIAHAMSGSFFRWFPGWFATELDIGWLDFWLRNWSLLPVLALAGFAWWVVRGGGSPGDGAAAPPDLAGRGRAVMLVLPFFVVFALINLFLFAPWIWDNTKLLVWATVGFSGLAAYFCVSLWRAAAGWRNARLAAWGVRAALVAAVGVSTASGGIDAYWVMRTDLHTAVLYTREELRNAEWVRRHTDRRSVWLTGAQHNHWLINLTGRQPLMAYRGWLWSHGMVFSQVEADVNVMLSTADPTLLARYRVDYVVIGPDELTHWSANERAFAERYPLAHSSSSYRVYRIGLHAPKTSEPATGKRE